MNVEDTRSRVFYLQYLKIHLIKGVLLLGQFAWLEVEREQLYIQGHRRLTIWSFSPATQAQVYRLILNVAGTIDDVDPDPT